MMHIPCPWCGLRAQIEFTYGGDASRRRPRDDAPLQEWVEYVYIRGNPCGAHRELWQHHAGCRQWFEVQRDTRTHVIATSAPVTR